jgi:phosphatidylglycerol:prolipoprotein diacylglycerol transferase
VDPVCFTIGGFKAHWYGVMLALGFLAGLLSWYRLGRTQGVPFNFCSDLLFWVMVGGIVGGRIAYVVSDLKSYLADPITILRVDQGGLIYYGGFMGGVLAVLWFAWHFRIPRLGLLDFAATSLPLGQAFGRLGCFMNGCCHGPVTDSALGVVYPKESLPWWQQVRDGRLTYQDESSLPVLPTQLFETAYALALFGFLVWLYRRKKTDGTVAAAYLIGYPAGRFLLEFLRGDSRQHILGLTMAQGVSLALLTCGMLLLVWGRRHPGVRPWPVMAAGKPESLPAN